MELRDFDMAAWLPRVDVGDYDPEAGLSRRNWRRHRAWAMWFTARSAWFEEHRHRLGLNGLEELRTIAGIKRRRFTGSDVTP